MKFLGIPETKKDWILLLEAADFLNIPPHYVNILLGFGVKIAMELGDEGDFLSNITLPELKERFCQISRIMPIIFRVNSLAADHVLDVSQLNEDGNGARQLRRSELSVSFPRKRGISDIGVVSDNYKGFEIAARLAEGAWNKYLERWRALFPHN